MMALPSPAALLAAGKAHNCPPPERPWLGRQSWQNMVLAHWAVPAAELQTLLPSNVTVDTLDGAAWVSVVAYRMANVKLRGMPNAWSLRFAQLNVRTYVRVNGQPGIYFFSLDAASPLAVRTGAWVTGLPYHLAKMQLRIENGVSTFASQRHSGGPAFAACYEPLDPIAKPSTRDRWLTERYVFYALRKDGRLHVGAVCHGPWPLCTAKMTISHNTLGRPLGINFTDTPDYVQYSEGVDVLFWRPVPLCIKGSPSAAF